MNATTMVSLQIPKEKLDLLDELRRADGDRSRSSLIRAAIDQYLAAQLPDQGSVQPVIGGKRT